MILLRVTLLRFALLSILVTVTTSIDRRSCDALTSICDRDPECRDTRLEFHARCLDSPLRLRDGSFDRSSAGRTESDGQRSGINLVVDSFEKLQLLKDAIKVIKRSRQLDNSNKYDIARGAVIEKRESEKSWNSEANRDLSHASDRQEIAEVVKEDDNFELAARNAEQADPTASTSARLILQFALSGPVLTTSQAKLVAKLIHRAVLLNVPSSDKIFRLKGINGNIVEYSIHVKPSLESRVKSIPREINENQSLKDNIEKEVGSVLEKATNTLPTLAFTDVSFVQKKARSHWEHWGRFSLITAIVSGCTLGIIIASLIVCGIKRRKKSSPIDYRSEAVKDYQELCRAQMSVNAQSANGGNASTEDGTMKHSKYGDPNGFQFNMDITTGHAVLSYMEDHLHNENRLNKEWEDLCCYEPEQVDSVVAMESKNVSKNRYRDVLPYDHTRVKLRETLNVHHSDYINASYITDVDPRNPDYIATQGPIENTVADFWQMIWEQGVVVIVNLTKLSDMGLQQCQRYWPEDGSSTYHQYEVNLISEHIMCEDYLVRSLYLKNLHTGETRTVTQFHYLAWTDLSVPNNPRSLLEFRRKVNKCYRGHACAVVVHCNNGVGRTGTYALLDMVLNKMMKGAREIDVAATLEHLREQRADCVKTKQQFEFVLLAVAEEVTTILNGLPAGR